MFGDSSQSSMICLGFVLFEGKIFRTQIIDEFEETLNLFRRPLVRLLLSGWKVIHESAFGTLH